MTILLIYLLLMAMIKADNLPTGKIIQSHFLIDDKPIKICKNNVKETKKFNFFKQLNNIKTSAATFLANFEKAQKNTITKYDLLKTTSKQHDNILFQAMSESEYSKAKESCLPGQIME